MAKFLAVWRQNSGCDYTIGCGIRVETIEAPVIDNVRSQVLEQFQNPDSYDEEMDSMRSVTIYKIDVSMSCDKAMLDDARGVRDKARADRALKTKDAREKAEFERLKKKFGET